MLILDVIWSALLLYYLAHRWATVAGPAAGALDGIVTKTDILRAMKQ